MESIGTRPHPQASKVGRGEGHRATGKAVLAAAYLVFAVLIIWGAATLVGVIIFGDVGMGMFAGFLLDILVALMFLLAAMRAKQII